MKAPTPRRDLYEAYWRFAAERHQIFERRLTGTPPPWTEDEILRRYRFCNAFRASDRVSQYLIRDVIYASDEARFEDTVVRTVLFRLFSRPSTWELIERQTGPVSRETFDADRIAAVLDDAWASDQRLYTSAFILCANASYGFKRKHRNHLALVDAMVQDRLPERLGEMQTLREIYEALIEYPLIGPFMAYQLAIDLNYGPQFRFSESDFTMPGPGAVRGLKKLFTDLGDHSPQDAIFWLVDQQARAPETFGVVAPSLFGRDLQAIDCQNLLCEVDKYARVAFPELQSNRRRMKRTYSDPLPMMRLFYPLHWEINDRIPKHARAALGESASGEQQAGESDLKLAA
jgi:hypothetical protein